MTDTTPNFLYRSDRLRHPDRYGLPANPRGTKRLRRERQDHQPEPPPAWTWRKVCAVVGPPC
jgi:hypothetical protein